MVPGVLGRQWGIRSYRFRRSGRDTDTTRIVAELLDANGQRLGEFVRTRYFRTEVTVDTDLDGTHKMKKRFLAGDHTQLAWANETVEIRNDQSTGSFRVKYNGHAIGSVVISPGHQEASPEIAAFLEERSGLLNISSDVGQDLDRALPEPPREVEKCCCGTNCLGSQQSCNIWTTRRSEGCSDAEACVGNYCSNSYCIGCCDMGGCDCECLQLPFVTGDYFCLCSVRGYACRCDTHCI